MIPGSYIEHIVREAPSVSIEDASRSVAKGTHVIDVRTGDEFQRGSIPGASHIARERLEFEIGRRVSMNDDLLVVCQTGVRSGLATHTLIQMGYRGARSIVGGIDAWVSSGRALTKPSGLSQREEERYARHLHLPSFGPRGQAKLKSSRVLVIGAGGLGSPAAYYLAAAGVGTISLMDDDLVDRSNLQRQILHNDERVGWPKVASGAASLRSLNPDIVIRPIQERFTRHSRVVDEHDLVIDGSDNFQTRYLANAACHQRGIPYVYGSAYGLEGQAGLFLSGLKENAPCYQCLHPQAPPSHLSPNCSEQGVLGAVPGVIGVLQAIEAIKYLGEIAPRANTLLTHFDAASGRFMALKVEQDPECPTCS